MKLLFYYFPLGTLLGSLLAATPALAQSVGIGTTSPNAAAALDITATATGKGLLIPRLDSATRMAIASPPTGLLVFQTSPRVGFYYYAGGTWLFLPDKARSGDNLGNHTATQNVNLQANALTGTGASIGTAVGLGVRADGGLNVGQNTPGGSVYLGYQAGQATTTGTGNTFVGINSGQNTTEGLGNTFVGLVSGQANTTGNFNTFSGYNSGLNNTTGGGNVFSGVDAGKSNTTGNSNTFSGRGSGANNTTGNFNTFGGRSSGIRNTTGENNVFAGANSGDQNTTGTGNVFMGTSAGQANAIGNNNVALGRDAGPSVDGLSNTIALGYNVRPTQSNTVILGSGASVGIGTTMPSALLDVAGSTRLRGLTTAGYVTTDALGNLGSSATVPGDNLGDALARSNVNLAGYALVGTGSSIGTAVGVGVRADGGLNLAQNSSGSNLLLGYQAGQMLTPGTLMGNNNLFIGYQAGPVTTTGRLNQFIGYQAGLSNTTGTSNQFEGYRSGNSNTSGSRNQFSGLNSGFNTTTGDNNTFSGYQSGLTNTTGSNNTAVGYLAGPSTSGLNNAAAFGYNARVSQNNSLVLGGTGADAVSVGIGTAAPAATLDVVGSTRLRGLTTAGYVTTDALGNLSSTATVPGDNLGNGIASTNVNLAGNLLVGGTAAAPSTTGLYVSGSGNVGIGTTTPATPLDVVGTAQATNAAVGTALSVDEAGTNTGGFTSNGSGLHFGGLTSGEGIASARPNNAPNQSGLDFYTAYTKRISVTSIGRVGIGTDAPSATLDVVGSTRLRGLTTAGVVMTDANGNLSSGTIAGDNLGDALARSNVNLAGYALVGTGASIGAAVGLGVRADGGLNIGQNTTGGSVYLGYQAGQAISSGTSNTFIGRAAGATTNTGGNNTFTGSESGINNQTGSSNSFYGLGSGDQNTTGSSNVFVGQSAGQANATGSNNVALGRDAGPSVNGLSNTIALGTRAQPTQSNTLLLGGSGANAVSVGIGTATPSSTLQVNGSLAVGVARNLVGGNTSAPVPLGSQGYYGLNPTTNNGSQDVYQLPDPGATPGRIYYLRNLSTSNTAYLTTSSGNGIFDAASNVGSSTSNLYMMSTGGSSKSVIAISDGVIWVVYRSSN